MHKSMMAALAATVVMYAGQAGAAELLANGGFETGDLSGWTTFTTANGVLGSPGVVAFDTSGDGPSNAAVLQVGQASFVVGSQQGGGLRQTFTSGAGAATFNADIAARVILGNFEGGVFSAVLDGMVLSTFGMGNMFTDGQIKLGSLSFNTTLTAGTHTLDLLVTRPFRGTAETPFQYFDNVSLDGVGVGGGAVPEPATWAMLIAGFGGIGSVARRRRTITA